MPSDKLTTRVFLAVLVIGMFAMRLHAQLSSEADSVALVKASKDTTILRQYALSRLGSRLGAVAQNRLGLLAYKNSQPELALLEYAQTADQYIGIPEATEATFYLGKISHDLGRYDHSKAYLLKFLNLESAGTKAEWGRFFLVRAMYETMDDRMEESVTSYFALPRTATSTKDAVVKYFLIKYLAAKRSFPRAVVEAKSLISQYPASHLVKVVEPWIADYYLLNGDAEAAVKHCQSMLQKYAGNIDMSARAQHVLASVYLGLGRYDEARAGYRKVRTDYSATASWATAAEFGLGWVDVSQGIATSDELSLQRGKSALEQAIFNHPDNRHVPRALLTVADLQKRAGRFVEALESYKKIERFNTAAMTALQPSSKEADLKSHRELVQQVHVARADLLLNDLNSPSAALEECDAILSDSSALSEVRLNKAKCLIELGRREEASEELRIIIDQQGKEQPTAQRLLEKLTSKGAHR